MYTIIVEKKVERFIKSLQKSAQGKVVRLKKLMVEYGGDLGMPHSKILSRRLYELRVRGKQEIRIFYTSVDHRVILFHGFIKKTYRTLKKELELAHKILKAIV